MHVETAREFLSKYRHSDCKPVEPTRILQPVGRHEAVGGGRMTVADRVVNEVIRFSVALTFGFVAGAIWCAWCFR